MIVIKSLRLRRILRQILPWVAIPLCVLLGATVFSDKGYAYVTLLVTMLSLLLFIAGFEKKRTGTRRLILVAVMVALSVAGRFLPLFKPITALTVLTAMYLGSEAGFLTGALSAVISNFYFGQGPWTPFQMLAWGLGGFLSGLVFFNKKLGKATLPLLVVVGFFVGVLYSAIMDVWSAVSMTGEFVWQAYLAALTTSLPFTIEYAVSNVIFLLVLYKPMDRRLTRIKLKFGVFGGGNNVPEIVTENF